MSTPRKFNNRSVVELGTLPLEEILNLEAWCQYAKGFKSPLWNAERKRVKEEKPIRDAMWVEQRRLIAEAKSAWAAQMAAMPGRTMTDAEFEKFLNEDVDLSKDVDDATADYSCWGPK